MDDPASLFLLLFAETAPATAESLSLVSIILNLLLVIALVFANGFFVAAEFAFVAVRKSRIETLAAEGIKSAKRLLNILNHMSAYLSAAQLGITLASLALGWVGEPAIAAMLEKPLAFLPPVWLHTISFIIAFGI